MTFQEMLAAERERQEEKWGYQQHDDGVWMLILTEEVGEAGKAALEDGDLVNELVQVAAVAQAWAEQIRDILNADKKSVDTKSDSYDN